MNLFESYPEPECLQTGLVLQGEPQRHDGGWVIEAMAQFYEKDGRPLVNDHLMMFRRGSGTKTIAERVPPRQVKIFDGHHWSHNSHTTAGVVLEAREGDAGSGYGVLYKGFLNGTEHGLVEKLRTQTINENSLELYVLREEKAEVPIDWIPEPARRWVELTPDGKVIVRDIREWMWQGIALCPASSQGLPAIIAAPTWVPFGDLPIASLSTTWEPEAAAMRIGRWAGESDTRIPRLARAHLGRQSNRFFGLIADAQKGYPEVIPEALEQAERELVPRLAQDPFTLAAVSRTLGMYHAKLSRSRIVVPREVQEKHFDVLTRENFPWQDGVIPGASVRPPTGEGAPVRPPAENNSLEVAALSVAPIDAFGAPVRPPTEAIDTQDLSSPEVDIEQVYREVRLEHARWTQDGGSE